jgi:hypothetical protein
MRAIPTTLLVALLVMTPAVAHGNDRIGSNRTPITASAGGGKYTVVAADGSLAEMTFGYAALVDKRGVAKGQLLHVGTFQGETIAFVGTVTCLAVDSENHRAWIGGVITRNLSTHPTYKDSPVTQVGHDIWFRVLDADHDGLGMADRTTFIGFEGAIPSSAQYCADRIWPDGNARTWDVTGNIVVKP